MDKDLVNALLSGLDQPDRTRTEELIEGQINADRAAALDGRPERQVDVGIRARARRKGKTGAGSDG